MCDCCVRRCAGVCEVLLLLQVKCLIKFAFFISIFWLFKNLNCIIKKFGFGVSRAGETTQRKMEKIKKRKKKNKMKGKLRSMQITLGCTLETLRVLNFTGCCVLLLRCRVLRVCVCLLVIIVGTVCVCVCGVFLQSLCGSVLIH